MNEEEVIPRFEFRTFGQNFEESSTLIARLSEPIDKKFWGRTSEEIYIVSKNTSVYNVKIRDNQLDIKKLIKTTNGFEQWKPTLKKAFPISKNLVRKYVIEVFKMQELVVEKEQYTLKEFLNLLNNPNCIKIVNLQKRRFGYKVNNTICEIAEVLVNGTKVKTINAESENIKMLKETVKTCNMEGFENINYVEAIKRIIGYVNKPLAN